MKNINTLLALIALFTLSGCTITSNSSEASSIESAVSEESSESSEASEPSEESSESQDPSVSTFPQDDGAGVSRLAFCIGRMTESAARKHGFETVTSDETTMDSLVQKIVEYYTMGENA